MRWVASAHRQLQHPVVVGVDDLDVAAILALMREHPAAAAVLRSANGITVGVAERGASFTIRLSEASVT